MLDTSMELRKPIRHSNVLAHKDTSFIGIPSHYQRVLTLTSSGFEEGMQTCQQNNKYEDSVDEQYYSTSLPFLVAIAFLIPKLGISFCLPVWNCWGL